MAYVKKTNSLKLFALILVYIAQGCWQLNKTQSTQESFGTVYGLNFETTLL